MFLPKKNLLLLFAVSALLTAACRRPRNQPRIRDFTDTLAVQKLDSIKLANGADSAAIKLAAETEDAKFDPIAFDFKYLSARAKFSFKNKTLDLDNANVNIRVRKDSLIWLSVSKIGLEVMRGIITQDSIQVVDKFNRVVYLYDFKALSTSFGFPLSYNLLQSLIVGNMPLPKRGNQRFKKENDVFMLRQEEGKVLIDSYVGEQNKRLKKLLAVDQPTKTSLTLDYDDFTELNSFVFPYSSLIQLNQQDPNQQTYQTVIRIKHQKVETMEQSPGFQFSVPATYKRK